MFASTICPGPYLGGKFPWIAEEVNKRLGVSDSAAKPTMSGPVLRRGSTGAQVKELQEKLIYIEYDLGKYGADGDFGSATETAVKEFQHNAGLEDDGVVGAATDKMLSDVYAFAKTYTFEKFVREVQTAIGAEVDGIPGTETLSKTVTISKKINPRHPVVKAVQKRLYALGYATVGGADGVAGSMFDGAMREYQNDNDCYVDGEVTSRKATWKALLKLG
jgi:peptidoglycan hydrolase-like protein with peptidoglycan-binding domain